MEVDTVTSPGIIIEELDEEGEPWNVLTTPDRQQWYSHYDGGMEVLHIIILTIEF